jgi:hypothetical protein
MEWNGAFMDFDDCGVFCTNLAVLQILVDINAMHFSLNLVLNSARDKCTLASRDRGRY